MTGGVLVLPDYIVNCGGLIGCYIEWAYRDELRASKIMADRVLAHELPLGDRSGVGSPAEIRLRVVSKLIYDIVSA